VQTVAKTILVATTLAALYLLFVLRHLVLTVFVAIIFATALRPVVYLVQRRCRLSRPVAVLALYGLITLATLVGTAALVPSVIGDALGLLERSPELYDRWYELAVALRSTAHDRLNVALPMPPPQPVVRGWILDAASSLQRSLPQFALTTGGALAQILLGLLMAYYWLEARDELLAFGMGVMPPARRARFLAICDEVERVLGAYLGGQLILSLLIGLASLLAFIAIGLPDPLMLAFISGLFHIVPLAGALIGAIPAILVAVALSPTTGLITLVALLLIHQLENSLIAPRVLQRQVGLSPLLVIIALAAGATLGGVIGALVAVPAAGALWVLARYLLVEPATRGHRLHPRASQVPVGDGPGTPGVPARAAAATDNSPQE
jgi:predicted PurR-regulated permease PerM